jgi:hypothetical protein
MASNFFAAVLGCLMVRLLLALIYSFSNRTLQRVVADPEVRDYPKLICIVLVFFFFNVDQMLGIRVFSQPIMTCLSASMTVFVYQSLQAGSRGASWLSIALFVFSVGFCGWSAASPKRMGVGIEIFGFFYVFHILWSVLGLIYEIRSM